MAVSAPPVSRTQLRRQETTARIVAAAWDLAGDKGVAGFSLAELAARLGMRAPSLYSYFPSKNAIYDAMFADGNRMLQDRALALPDQVDAREFLVAVATLFVDFATEDPARYSLLFGVPVPRWQPAPEAYAVAVQTYEDIRLRFTRYHDIAAQEHLDLWTGLVAGLMAQQVSNDPTGDRWKRLIEPVVDLYLGYVRTHVS